MQLCRQLILQTDLLCGKIRVGIFLLDNKSRRKALTWVVQKQNPVFQDPFKLRVIRKKSFHESTFESCAVLNFKLTRRFEEYNDIVLLKEYENITSRFIPKRNLRCESGRRIFENLHPISIIIVPHWLDLRIIESTVELIEVLALFSIAQQELIRPVNRRLCVQVSILVLSYV